MTHADPLDKRPASQRRFTLQELLLATALAAIPLAGQPLIGTWAAVSFGLMGIALTLGSGVLALVFLCAAFTATVIHNTSLEAILLSAGFALIVALGPVVNYRVWSYFARR